MKLNKSAFAKHIGVTRQAINDAVKRGLIDVEGEGRKGRIDTEAYKTVKYIKNRNNNQRKGPAERLALEAKRTRKRPEQKNKSAQSELEAQTDDETFSIEIPRKGNDNKNLDELLEIAERLEIAKTEKMEQQAIAEKIKNARLRGELIDKEKTYNFLFLYLDKLHSNIERLADSYLSDMGGRIIDAKKILPEHRMTWKSEVMSQINNAKDEIATRIKEIQKSQR